MKHDYPITYTLESGTEVRVHRSSADIYDFELTTEDGRKDNFTYTEDGRSKDEVEANLDFDQLNALRAFWLKREEIE